MSHGTPTAQPVGVRRYQRYRVYKDSDVEWLGEIPAHWIALPLKRLVDPARPVTYGIVQCGPDYHGGVPYIRPVDMADETGVEIGGLQRTSPEIAAAYARSTVRPGDIVVSIGPSFGKAMIVPTELDGANLTQGTARIAPGRRVTPRFLFWALRTEASRMAWDSFCSGATFRALTLEILEACEVSVPPEVEQRAIAAFLDRETARIDALVAKKEWLIELLQEKRTALITRAVTKGLDPAVPMKDSGVGWLGEIPAHWEVKRLKDLSPFVTSGSRGWAEHYTDDGSLFLRIGNLKAGSLDLDLSDVQHVSPPTGAEGERTKVRPGDILVSITALIGAVAVVPEAIPTAFVNQHLALVRLVRSNAIPRWIGYCVLSRVGQEQLRATLYGGTKDGLNLDDIRLLALPVPPRDEQERLVSALNHHQREISALIAEIHNAIERLKELRIALISAAVTGKIDVREAAA